MKKCFVALVLFLVCGIGAGRTPAQSPNYVGFFDVGDCNVIAGWAADKNRPNVAINVGIYDGSTLLTTVLANNSRADSAAIGAAVGSGDNGLHAFSIPFPSALKTGLPRAIGVRFESTNVELTNSPRSITCLKPLFNTGAQTILAVDFKLNNGAASTLFGRLVDLVNLTFTASERTGSESRDVTAEVTHYRVLESPDLRDASLSGQPWNPLERPLRIALAERNGAGQRYGDRKVMFQVKTAALTSNVVSDTITVDPVLKKYRVSASGDVHPLIQYAASQGFTFLLSFYNTCQGDCQFGIGADASLATGTANVLTQVARTGGGGGHPGGEIPNIVTCVAVGAVVGGVAASIPGAVVGAAIGGLICSGSQPAPGTATCITKADYILFDGRTVNRFWTIKSVSTSGSPEVFVRYHGLNKFLLKFIHEPKDATCFTGTLISIGDVVVEGPEVDDFVDEANPWKNAFVRVLTRPIDPTNTNRRPD